ncbi:sulfotransferase family 2 domain-containing protein [Rhizobium multihospitium]|uniref:Sulfotransferase family protein n=1 Tax=Rhizobium multihospitium TaxID=410764 RepID=A0A1C3XBH7_9HYPH|nr:sulfotransferase family 2 domain-containing protein [Rhizobium multihospitium]SCB49324.1 Sulfotransferase family protein [Rhizobium multihospitium]
MDKKGYSFSNLYNEYDRVMRLGDIEQAYVLLEAYLKQLDDPNAWMIYGQILLCLGHELAAKSIFRNCYEHAASIHIADVIHADCEATIAFVDDSRKLLYVAIPKCASTTVKNYFVRAIYSKDPYESSHDHLNNMMRVVKFREFNKKYSDYYKFTVVRPAQDRISSYFYGNILKGALKNNSWGLDALRGITTKPSLSQFLGDFFSYRKVFIDVRHHTDPINAYLPEKTSLDAIYSINQIDEVRSLIEDMYHVKLEASRLMIGAKATEDVHFSSEMVTFYERERQYIEL